MALEQFASGMGLSCGIAIHAKIFGNVGGIGAALKDRGVPADADNLRSFFAGFSSQKGLFDFIDVGSGKEGAASKLQGTLWSR